MSDNLLSESLYDRDEYTIEASYVAFSGHRSFMMSTSQRMTDSIFILLFDDSANVSMNNIDFGYKQVTGEIVGSRKKHYSQ